VQFQVPSRCREGRDADRAETISRRVGKTSCASSEKTGQELIVATGAHPDTETYTITLKPAPAHGRSIGLEIARDDTMTGATSLAAVSASRCARSKRPLVVSGFSRDRTENCRSSSRGTGT